MAAFLSGCGGASKPVSVNAAATSTTVDGGNSITLTAAVKNDKNAAGVSWALSGGGALSGQTATSVKYTAPAATANAVTVTINATSVADTTKSSSVTITVPAKPSITTTALAAGSVGSTYSVQLSASGGISPYTWTLTSGTLPSCIALSSGGVLASTSGLMASCAGTANLTLQVTDSGKATALTAAEVLPLTVNAAPAIAFNGTMPETAVTGNAFTGSAAATGGAGTLTYSVVNGTLPAGLTLNTSTGAVTGSPSAAGNSNFTIKAADAYGDSNTWACKMLVVTPLALNSTTLPTTGTINVAYTGTITASGGSGSYTWQITGLPSDSLSATTSANTLTVGGTPTTAATVNFTVKLTDTTTNLNLSRPFTVTINSPAPVTLPAPNPASLPAATVNQAYAGAIIASGGVGPYTWSVNGVTVTGVPLPLSNGLAVTNAGSNVLAVAGTPTTTTAVALQNVKVTDSLGSNATQTYSITVNNATGLQLSGQILLSRYCGNGGTQSLPTMTLTLGTSPTMQTTTDSNGNFSFNNVPSGNFTLTPSISGPPDGPASLFQPATQVVSIGTLSTTGVQFTVMLGYTISGTVAYHGATTGRTYLNLIGGCGGGIGTSLSEDALTAGGSFTLHGVPPGTYSLTAWMDPSTLANAAPNDADPRGTVQALTVSPQNLTGVALTMTDPTVAAQTVGPTLKGLNPTNGGVVISYGEGSVTDQTTGMEVFSSYTVQWSTTFAFSGTPSGATFKATGTKYSVWMVNNGNNGMTGTLTPGTAYYFRVRGTNAGGNSNWVYWGGAGNACSSSSCAVAVRIGEPSGSSYATVTGTVTITSEMTPLVTGPLYVGYYDQNARNAYGYVVTNPIIGDNGYSISVLKSTTAQYTPYAILDQNKDGLIDANDVTNFVDNPPPVMINNSQTGLIELSYLYDQPRVQTHFLQMTIAGRPGSHTYDLKFLINPGNKLPVATQLTAGPNVLTPVDIGNLCLGCGGEQLGYEVYLGSATPQVADIYTFQTTFSDGSVQTDYGQVMGFGGSGTLTGTANVPTGLAPTGNNPGEIQPLFTWTYPTAGVPGPITYQFWVCCSGPSLIWSIPGYNSNAPGFTPSQIPGPLAWGTDPTDDTNKPYPSVLTSGTTYWWQIMGQDDWGNTAAAQTEFIP